MLRDPAGKRVPAHNRLEQMADDRMQDDQPMRRDPECEPDRSGQPQWCLGGLTRSQKQTLNKKGVKTHVWRVKAKADDESAGNSSTPIQVVGSLESS